MSLSELPTATIDVPILKLGRDVLPTSCANCGSGFLTSDVTDDGTHWGVVSCAACGAVLAYLGNPPGRSRGLYGEIVQARQAVHHWRLDGCSDDCREGSHAPDSHELWGRFQALAELRAGAQATGVVTTGPLLVDLGARSVMLGGELLVLTKTEYEVLAYLAARIGKAVSSYALVTAIWGESVARLQSVSVPGTRRTYGSARMALLRLRLKLGPAASLIHTVDRYGWRLEKLPVEGEAP